MEKTPIDLSALHQERNAARKAAMQFLEAGNVRAAVAAMRDALKATAEIAAVQLAEFEKMTTPPAPPEFPQ